MNADEREATPDTGATDVPGESVGDDAAGALRYELDRLPELDDLPVAEHVARFEALHAALTAALSRVDRV